MFFSISLLQFSLNFFWTTHLFCCLPSLCSQKSRQRCAQAGLPLLLTFSFFLGFLPNNLLTFCHSVSGMLWFFSFPRCRSVPHQNALQHSPNVCWNLWCISFTFKMQPWITASCSTVGKPLSVNLFFFPFSGTVEAERAKAICQVQISL